MIRLMFSSVLFVLSVLSASAFAGYTILAVPQVAPAFIVVHGAAGTESRPNPGPGISYPAGSTVIYRPADFDLYSADATKRVLLLEDPAGTATDAAVLAAFPGLKSKITADILAIRKAALAKVTTDNAGVLAIYDENYLAAKAVMRGEGDTIYTKDAQTATAYLAAFGARLGMDAGQFAAWLISQNQQVGVLAGRVEDEYLRLAYSAIPYEPSVAKLLAYPAQYREFCGL